MSVNHLHAELDLGANDVVEVILTRQANAMLMDRPNYTAYVSGRGHSYFGGYATHSPTILTPPRAGRWNLVIDLGGAPGTMSATYRVIPGAR